MTKETAERAVFKWLDRAEAGLITTTQLHTGIRDELSMEEEDERAQNNSLQEDRVRVLRLIEYEGPRKDVEAQVSQSIQGTRIGMKTVRITVVTLGQFPEVIEAARTTPDPGLTPESDRPSRVGLVGEPIR